MDKNREISPNSRNIFDEDSVKLSNSDATTSMKVLQAKAILEEATKDTTIVRRNQSKAPRVSWFRRLLNWF